MAENSSDQKPLSSFAPPPLSALVSALIFVGASIYYFPNMNEGSYDATLFTQRVFPEYVSESAILAIRAFFALICLGGFLSGWTTQV